MANTGEFGFWGSTSEEILKSQFPLHHACRDGDVEALSALLHAGQHSLYEEDGFYGWTPAHWAAYFGKLICLMRLLEHGASCEVQTSRFMQSPSHIAAYGGRNLCLKWLIHCGASLNRQDYLGETALHKAARTGSVECVSLLISQAARMGIKNHSDQLPSDLARACGFNDCALHIEQSITMYSPGIITTNNQNITSSQEHTIIRSGCNGGVLPSMSESPGNQHISMDCDMEGMESSVLSEHCSVPLQDSSGLLSGVRNADVLLHHGVSTNEVPIGGRKRVREEMDEQSHKRIRTGDIIWDENNECSMFAQLYREDIEDLERSGPTCCDQAANNSTLPSKPSIPHHPPSVVLQEINHNDVQMDASRTNFNFPVKFSGLNSHFI